MRRVIIAVAAAAAVAVAIMGGAIAYASIPDSSGVIHGCYTVKGGSLRVIDTAKGQTCATGQHSLNWNQKGSRGPAGVSGYQVESYTPSANNGQGDNTLGSASVDSTNYTHVQLYCPPGKVALSSGYTTPGTGDGTVNIQLAHPFSDGGGSGYKFAFGTGDGTPTLSRVTVYVTCANAS